MKTLYYCCIDEIHGIMAKGFTPERLEWLEELVDICKDIRYMEYLDEKIAHYRGEASIDHHGLSKAMSFDDMVERLHSIHERAMNSGVAADKDQFKHDALEMIDCARKVKALMSSMPIDGDVAARYKELFR